MPSALEGRVALITGAAQGLGLEIARRLHRDGAAVGLVDIDGELLNEAVAHLRRAPHQSSAGVIGLVADLADPDEVSALPDLLVQRLGRLDVLVNNAGVRSVSPVVEHSLDAWQATLAVNLTAPFLLVRASAPHMVRVGKGKIVNITSVAAELSFGERSAYNVSKAGLAALTRSVALELAGSGIRCNSVAPGIIATGLNSSYVQAPEFAEIVRANIPAGAVGFPTDIAAAVAFLCADESDYVNGTTLTVDGGWSTGKGY